MAKQPVGAKAKARARRGQGLLIGGVLIAALIVVVIVFFVINQMNSGNAAAITPSSTYSQIPQTTTSDGAPVLGNPDAKITIMEFADFSCPHCMEYHPTIQQLIDQYVRPGKAKFILRPETFVGGQYSEVAAEAALCAGKQGKFWEVHDALFQIQASEGYTAFNLDRMKTLSDSLKLNTSQFLSCITQQDTLPTIQQSYNLGEQLGVTGTPAVLYSTDGRNFEWWKDSGGQPFIPPFQVIAQTIDQYS